ncbi:MAG TPA: 4Fe-4S dicluster domain-containing protein [Phycisphaerae bacterium]|nr:4Fe-4S dicluster domain-containing protein [Phycisphaerae bacterium]
MSEILSQEKLRRLAGEWASAGKKVIGPKRIKPGLVLYAGLNDADELLLDGFVHPANSIKEVVFPRHEVLYSYRFEGKQIGLGDPEPIGAENVVVGARPCDAAMLPILDHVFNWDYRDAFYNRRRELTTVITMACSQHDDQCFCTSVGLAPDATQGSDILLVDLGDGSYEVRFVTDKGRKLLAGRTESSNRVGQVPAGPEPKFDPAELRAALDGGFDSPAWRELTLRCMACGACSYSCPTCHCFDIVDEGNARGGVRVKNWDACQFGLFTLHASGHNPRTVQGQRQRQRLYHKFSIYPARFGPILCTGCGNCTRNCPVGLGVQTVARQAVRRIPVTGKAAKTA